MRKKLNYALGAMVVLSLFAGVAAAAVTDMANEEVTFDNESNLTVAVNWTTDADTTQTADVTIKHEGAYQIDGDDVTDGHLTATTLNGTVAEFDPDNVTDGVTYDVELDQSATTVSVPASSIPDDGTVDLSTHTSSTLTADDTVLSVTANADTVVSDEIAADPGNETESEYTESDGLEDGTVYRVVVSADDTEAESVTVDAGIANPLAGVADGNPGFGVGAALGALVAAALVVVAAVSYRGGN